MIRVRTILIVAFLALLLGIAWQIVSLWFQKTVAYQGTPLSVWLQDYEFGKQTPETDKAVRAMGTNALPTLMGMLHAEDSPLRLRFLALAQKQHWIQFHYTPAETLHMRAVLAFKALGAEGKSKVPELIEMYKQAPSDGPWGPGAVLAEIGPDASAAIPALLVNVTNANQGARELSVAALGRIHSNPELVIPVLIRELDDVSPVRYQAVIGLGFYGKVATNAAPALLALLKNPTSNYRGNIARALTEIQVPPETVVGALTDCLSSSNTACRLDAVMALKDLGWQARSALPGLRQLLNDDDQFVRQCAGETVGALSPNTRPPSDAH